MSADKCTVCDLPEEDEIHLIEVEWKPKKKEKPILAAIRKLREANLPRIVDLKRNKIQWGQILENARAKVLPDVYRSQSQEKTI